MIHIPRKLFRDSKPSDKPVIGFSVQNLKLSEKETLISDMKNLCCKYMKGRVPPTLLRPENFIVDEVEEGVELPDHPQPKFICYFWPRDFLSLDKKIAMGFPICDAGKRLDTLIIRADRMRVYARRAGVQWLRTGPTFITNQVTVYATPEERRLSMLKQCERFSRASGFLMPPKHLLQWSESLNAFRFIDTLKCLNIVVHLVSRKQAIATRVLTGRSLRRPFARFYLENVLGIDVAAARRFEGLMSDPPQEGVVWGNAEQVREYDNFVRLARLSDTVQRWPVFNCLRRPSSWRPSPALEVALRGTADWHMRSPILPNFRRLLRLRRKHGRPLWPLRLRHPPGGTVYIHHPARYSVAEKAMAAAAYIRWAAQPNPEHGILRRAWYPVLMVLRRKLGGGNAQVHRKILRDYLVGHHVDAELEDPFPFMSRSMPDVYQMVPEDWKVLRKGYTGAGGTHALKCRCFHYGSGRAWRRDNPGKSSCDAANAIYFVTRNPKIECRLGAPAPAGAPLPPQGVTRIEFVARPEKKTAGKRSPSRGERMVQRQRTS